MSLWICPDHGLVAPMACCTKASFARIDPIETSASITESNPPPRYMTRKCRGDHWHVTSNGEDLAVPGDPFFSQEAAQAMADALNESVTLSTIAANSFLTFEATL